MSADDFVRDFRNEATVAQARVVGLETEVARLRIAEADAIRSEQAHLRQLGRERAEVDRLRKALQYIVDYGDGVESPAAADNALSELESTK